MKLSEKIVQLRKANGITQEELAAACGVSRQSISKWEADIALPEIEKLLILGKLFQVSLDVLIKDELTLNEIKVVSACGYNSIQDKRLEIFEGVLIKESISDDTIIDFMNIHKVELWNTGNNQRADTLYDSCTTPKYWTVLFFTSNVPDFPARIARVMKNDPNTGGNWFVDFKAGNTKYIVFKDKILSYLIGDSTQKDAVCEQCRQMGIPDNQMNWTE